MRGLRLLRVLRLLRLGPSLARRVFGLDGVKYAALLAFVTLFAGGSASLRRARRRRVGGRLVRGRDDDDGRLRRHHAAHHGRATDRDRDDVVGIGFGTLLIGSAAERFIATRSTPSSPRPRPSCSTSCARSPKRLERIELLMSRRAS